MNTQKIKEALTPDQYSQAAYAGRVKQTEIVEVFTEDGTPIQKQVTFYLSWDSIVQILAIVRKRAEIEP